MLRVVVIDDSPTARQWLVAILDADPEIQVVGTARNGREGVEITRDLLPDVVTMDIQMPVMNGFEATREIMITCPRPIVVVSASSLVADAENAMRALQAGALTLISKPFGPASPGSRQAAQRLVETVKAMAEVKVIRRSRGSQLSADERADQFESPSRPIEVIGMVASTGGPPALQAILSQLPADFRVPVLIVQHLAAGFIEGLVSWLDSAVNLTVKVAEQGEPVAAGTVYVGPDERHLGVTRKGAVLLSDRPAIDGFRPSADYLFQSLAAEYGSAAWGVILTGMGRDGVAGLREVRAAGGRVLAQNAESCVVNGMPGAAVAARVVDRVLSLEAIAEELRVGAGRRAPSPAARTSRPTLPERG